MVFAVPPDSRQNQKKHSSLIPLDKRELFRAGQKPEAPADRPTTSIDFRPPRWPISHLN
jgi:hypothetical protein